MKLEKLFAEQRRGKIQIHDRSMGGWDLQALGALFTAFTPISVVLSGSEEYRTYYGYSEQFSRVSMYDDIPMYEVTVIKPNDGEYSVMFNKVFD